jgi:hypothetical protein
VYCEIIVNVGFEVEVTCSSETSVDFQRTTESYIPQDKTLVNDFPLHSFLHH